MDLTRGVVLSGGRGLNRRQFIIGTAALAGSPWLPAFAAAKPNLRLGLLSDVHVSSPRGPSPDAYRKALERFRDAHVDGVCITGDLAIWGQVKELEFGARIWFDVFPDDKLPDGSPVARLFCTGNHDDDGWSYQGAYSGYARPCLEEARKTSYFFHRQETWKRLYREDWAPIFFKEVKGYKFVLSNWLCRVEHAPIAEGKVRNEKRAVGDWFAVHGSELPSDRPFFFLQHDPPRGTCNAPDSKGDDCADTFEALKPFPNCIALSGHTHFPTVDAKSIWQGEFTAINCGSTCGWAFTGKGRENGHSAQDGTEEMPFLPDVKNCRQGLLMDVYDDRITVSRFEVLSGRPSGPDWVIPLGTSAARPYRFETRAAASRPPVFPADAVVSVRRLADGQNRKKEPRAQIEVRFPAVNGLTTKGDRAYDYCVDVTVGERVAASRRVFSPMCLRPADEDIGDVVCLFAAKDVPDAGEVRFVVTPVNEWGKRGAPIFGKYTGES